MKKAEQSIGVFDSGLGGLTAVKELKHILPQENIVYFGDTGRVPYGNRGKDTIRRYALQDAAFLLSQGVKLIIAACGTVSSVATNLGDSLPVPFTGVVTPTASAAVRSTRNKRIGVIGTTATIQSGSYRREMEALDPHIQVFERDCPLFVPLVENGFVQPEDPIPHLVAQRYLSFFEQTGVDTLILGCTHYPIIAPMIQQIMGDGVTLIDPGRETALYARKLLTQERLLNNTNTCGQCKYFVSDAPDGFSSVASLFLGENIQFDVTRIAIESYEGALGTCRKTI